MTDRGRARRRRRWKRLASAIAPRLDRKTARERTNVIEWWIDFRVEHDQPVDMGTRQDVDEFFEWRDEQPVQMWAYYTDKQYSVVVRSWLRWWGVDI